MPFPPSARAVYQHNPLVEVICQLRFPTILEIGQEDPAAFQKEIRATYPVYRKEDPVPRLPPELSAILSQMGVPGSADRVTYRFVSADSNRTISLSREFVAVSDSAYQRWEVFRQEVERAKQAVERVYQPAFYSRLGLRYRDVIDQARLGLSDEPWKALLNPSLVGVLNDANLETRVAEMQSEILLRLDVAMGGFGKLRCRLVPSDENAQRVFEIDADFFTQERSEGNAVLETLDAFHGVAGNFFRWAISPRLEEALGPKALG